MGTQHTPGPWYADKLDDSASYNVFVPSYCSALVQLGAMENSAGHMHPAEIEANARLIAAAPELLAALRDCREALRKAGADGELRVVDAAIQKATGGAA